VLAYPQQLLANWTGPCACSSAAPWAGVTCDASGQYITVLDLSSFWLSGTFSTSSDTLMQLHHLQVSCVGHGSTLLTSVTWECKAHMREIQCPGRGCAS